MTISLNRLDLNLLRVFNAVMEERSVLRASQRICLSQSAVSHALARLREVLGDELFIRTATGMQPTARARTMAPLISEAWKSLEAAIGLPEFEPRKSTKRFTIAVTDFVTAVMIPHLLGLLRCEAPFVDIVIRSDSQIDLTEHIDLGRVDAAIGTFAEPPPRFRSSSLFAYDDVLIASAAQALGKMSIEKLSAMSIVVISLHGGQDGIVDRCASARGLVRRSEMYDRTALENAVSSWERSPRIAVYLPHFLALPSLLEDSHLTAIVPRPLARSLARVHPLSIHELPYETSLAKVSVVWHERNTKDASQQWLREMLSRATKPLRARLIECGSPTRTSSAALLPRTAAGT
jgi:DNA-binding transcriptional LysR family regulator